jgi:hypothetical protein
MNYRRSDRSGTGTFRMFEQLQGWDFPAQCPTETDLSYRSVRPFFDIPEEI